MDFKDVDLLNEGGVKVSVTRDDRFYFLVIQTSKDGFVSYNLEKEEVRKLLTGDMRMADIYEKKSADIVTRANSGLKLNAGEEIKKVPCYNLYVNYSKYRRVREFLEDL